MSYQKQTVLGVVLLSCGICAAADLGSTFTYQGSLHLAGEPVNDTADFEFTLWDDPSAGAIVGATQALTDVVVVDGVFTVELDFGVAAFNGDERWLEIAVRSPAGVGNYTLLSPRQPVTATPYALQTRGIFVSDAGNVGIGIDTPQNQLHVTAAGATANIRLSKDDNNYANNLVFSGSGTQYNFGTPMADRLRVWNDQAGEVLTILSSGNVGIGTTAPGAKLGVAGDIRVSDKVESSAGNLELSGGGFGVRVDLDVDGGSNDAFVVYDTDIERFRVEGNTGTVTAAAFVGDGSGLTNVGGDDLGDHTATQALDMGSFDINNAGAVTATSFIGDGSGLSNVAGKSAVTSTVLVEVGNGFKWSTWPTILDQENTSSTGAPAVVSAWQSFTAGASGDLAAVAVKRGYLNLYHQNPATVRVYEGEGTGGALLGVTSLPRSLLQGWQAASLSLPIPIVGGNQYTIELESTDLLAWLQSTNNPYAGGRADGNASWDFTFRTYVLDLTGDHAPTLVADGDGNVGIGTDTPTTKLHVDGTITANSFVGDASGLVVGSASEIVGATGMVRVEDGIKMYTRPTSLDQEYTEWTGGTSGFVKWQSFTAGVTGDLAVLGVLRTIAGENPGSPADVRVYEGEGTDGALLSTATIPASTSLAWQAASLPSPVSIVAGNQYTIELVGTSQLWWVFDDPGAYDGGIGGPDPWDYCFRTYVLDDSGDLSATFVVDGNGNVGIGTSTPSAMLHVNGEIQFGAGESLVPVADTQATAMLYGYVLSNGDLDSAYGNSPGITVTRIEEGLYEIEYPQAFPFPPIVGVTPSVETAGDKRVPMVTVDDSDGFKVRFWNLSGDSKDTHFFFTVIGLR